MKRTVLCSLAIAFLAGGCAPSVHRGSVAMKISPTEAHVCLGVGEVAAGDRITLFRSVCTKATKTTPRCEKKLIGHGTIKTILNEHYSIAAMDEGVDYLEGDIVERQR